MLTDYLQVKKSGFTAAKSFKRKKKSGNEFNQKVIQSDKNFNTLGESHNVVEPNNLPSGTSSSANSIPEIKVSSSDESLSVLENTLHFCSQEMSMGSLLMTDGEVANQTDNCRSIDAWGLPRGITKWYHNKGITELFDWQVDCLSIPSVIQGGNLIFSAPTSAGKTMVADILMLRRILTEGKKAIFILPFISVGREKVNNLKSITRSVNINVGGFMGSSYEFGGLEAVDIAVCTIEKANGLVNKVIEAGELGIIGTIVVDELHMLGDPHRGYLLELLLSKVHYLCKMRNFKIQIIGMSATIPNLEDVARWLDAELYKTDYRPIPFSERLKISEKIYEGKDITYIGTVPNCGLQWKLQNDILYLILETVLEGNGVLVFCQSKAKCEELAEKIATFFYALMHAKRPDISNEITQKINEVIKSSNAQEILDQLERTPAALEPAFKRIMRMAVAFHHAGLSQDERDIVEDGFRRGILKVLTATSTLSCGVNLPARRVIIQSPIFYNEIMDITTYKQMVGRAGRKGIDSSGESYLVCSEREEKEGKYLIQAELREIKSCLGLVTGDEPTRSFKRAILEVVSSGLANDFEQVKCYLEHTFFITVNGPIDDVHIRGVLDYLISSKFILESPDGKYSTTKLGQAVLHTSVSPEDALSYVKELEKARKAFVLSNDLHILFEILLPTKINSKVDWNKYFDLWNSLDDDTHHVARIIGIDPNFISKKKCFRNFSADPQIEDTHARFYYALVLNDLVSEVPLKLISDKYNMSKGDIQQLQLHASTFAGIITIFCKKLGFDNLDLIIGQYRDRLEFGVQRELIDLMRLSCLTAPLARELYKAGFLTIISLARSKVSVVENALRNSAPFKLGDSNELRKLWIAGLCRSMTDREIAEMVVLESREQVEKDIGTKIKWENEEMVQGPKNLQGERKRRRTKSKRLKDILSSSRRGQNSGSEEALPKVEEDDVYEQEISDSLAGASESKAPVSIKNSEADDEFSDSSITSNQSAKRSLGAVDVRANKIKKIDPLSDEPVLKSTYALANLGIKLTECRKESQVNDIMRQLLEKKMMVILFGLDVCNVEEVESADGLVLLYNKCVLIEEIIISFGPDEVFVIRGRKLLEMFRENLEKTLNENIEIQSQNKLDTDEFVEQNVSRFKLVVYDLNTSYKILLKVLGLEKPKILSMELFDIRLEMWMSNPDVSGSIGLKDLLMSIPTLSSTIINDPDSKSIQETDKYHDLYWSAANCLHAHNILYEAIKERELLSVLNKCEVPVMIAISTMELVGFGINLARLKSFIYECTRYAEQLYLMARKVCGEDFNIESPKEIGMIIYRKLKLLSHLSKTGEDSAIEQVERLNTDKSILKKLAEYHPFPLYVMKLRKLHHVLALARLILVSTLQVDGYGHRVSGFSSFCNATGRISMENPNLLSVDKNFEIPLANVEDLPNKQEAEQKEISLRKAFVARPGYLLLAADYCQLELRVMAHLSKDALLLDALSGDGDVFIAVASHLTSKSQSEITVSERKLAKEICYGIIYGMGNDELASRINSSKEEAVKFREEFFSIFKGLNKYIESCKAKCRERKYVMTLHRRRRYIHDMDSKDPILRGKAERRSVNTVIQGSAADIIKFAILKVDRELQKFNLDAVLIAQMHDELIYEVRKDVFHFFSKRLEKCMESSANKLAVKMPVKMFKGKDWGSLKEFECLKIPSKSSPTI